MDKVQRVKELTAKLNEYRNAYYNDSESLISDYEYDTLFDELQKLEDETGVVMTNSPTRTVGYEVTDKFKKVKHSHPMLSLGKTKSVDDLMEFAGNEDCILSLKMDGLTVSLTYDNGELVKAETRGNGEVGEDVTQNAKVFENIPLKIGYKGHLELDGEAIITYHDFEKINEKLSDDEKYKNPRNLASGSLRQLDSGIAAHRHLKFVCWKVVSDVGAKFHERLFFAKTLGFEIVPIMSIRKQYKTEIQATIEELREEASEKGYPIDGLVLTYNNIAYGESLGMTGHHPKHSIAFKFYDEEVETTIIDVEFTMGKTGSLTPVAIFDTVEIDGTEVSRASLHNLSILEDLEIGIGDTVTVYKANQIIPQVKDNLTRSGILKIPNTCPVCGSETVIVVNKDSNTKVLMCTNPNCKGKLLGELTHAVSKNALNIDGLSESTLDKFIECGYVSSISDIYYLYNYTNEIANMEGFGQKSAEKLIKSITESRNTTLDRFIYALSIPLIGRTASKDISKACGGDVNEFILNMEVGNSFAVIDGFGAEMDKSLRNWWLENSSTVTELIPEFRFEVSESDGANTLEGKTFVITGSLTHYKNRDELVSVIESMGGKVSGSVSAKTDYLINNDIESQSSKNKKARQLNIPIISEEDFISLIS